MLASGLAQSQPEPGTIFMPSDPVDCRGNEVVVLQYRIIETDGVAVSARGNCEVSIGDSRIYGGTSAIEARGNAVIEISSSEIRGRVNAISLRGSATARYENSVIIGAIETQGYARAADLGGNRIDGRRTEPAGETSTPGLAELIDQATTVRIGPGGEVLVDQPGSGTLVRIGPDGIEVQDDQGHQAQIGQDGTVSATDGLATVAVDGGWVGIRSDQEAVDVHLSQAWRAQPRTTPLSAEHLAAELGVREDSGRLQLDLPGDVLFAFDSAEIQPSAAESLARVAQLIRDRASGRVEVIGHTDSIGAVDYNLALSERRAVAVMQWLHQQHGIPGALLVGRGMGASQPITHNNHPDGSDDPVGRARNRRVEIRFDG